MGLFKKDKRRHVTSISEYRNEQKIANMIKTLPSHVYAINEKGKKVLVPRTEEVAEKEREWNYMYDRSMELLKRARKAKFLGIFGFVPETLREEIVNWQCVLDKWRDEFGNYERKVCPVVSDRKEYMIKAFYLGYYAEHTFSALDYLINGLGLGGYIFRPAYLLNTHGCERRFTHLEEEMLEFNCYYGRATFNPKLIGFLNRISSVFNKGKIFPYREVVYIPMFDSGLNDLTPEEQALKDKLIS